MHVSDMTGQRRQILQRDELNDEIPNENPSRDLYMGIDTPSDEFYSINTTQYVPPMLAMHKLQPRLPKPNQSPSTFPKKQTKQRWTGPIYQPAHIYKLLSQEVKDAIQKYNVYNGFQSIVTSCDFQLCQFFPSREES